MTSNSTLHTVLNRAREIGFLGPGSVDSHIDHAYSYLPALEGYTGEVIDLGAGGGVPSLPLMLEKQETPFTLVDASQKRCAFLQWALIELGLIDRGEVYCGRAEAFASDAGRRHSYGVVIARGFGPPASTLECAAPLLNKDGICVISEPPQARKWPAAGLQKVGLEEIDLAKGIAVFRSSGQVDKKYPRNPKLQKSSPLFTFE